MCDSNSGTALGYGVGRTGFEGCVSLQYHGGLYADNTRLFKVNIKICRRTLNFERNLIIFNENALHVGGFASKFNVHL